MGTIYEFEGYKSIGRTLYKLSFFMIQCQDSLEQSYPTSQPVMNGLSQVCLLA